MFVDTKTAQNFYSKFDQEQNVLTFKNYFIGKSTEKFGRNKRKAELETGIIELSAKYFSKGKS